jgi:hypothetical protein
MTAQCQATNLKIAGVPPEADQVLGKQKTED